MSAEAIMEPWNFDSGSNVGIKLFGVIPGESEAIASHSEQMSLVSTLMLGMLTFKTTWPHATTHMSSFSIFTTHPLKIPEADARNMWLGPTFGGHLASASLHKRDLARTHQHLKRINAVNTHTYAKITQRTCLEISLHSASGSHSQIQRLTMTLCPKLWILRFRTLANCLQQQNRPLP